MGASVSKIAVASTPKPEPTKPSQRIKNQRVTQLADPRSPSTVIDRTPIQVGGAASRAPTVESAGPLVFSDPRSPTVGISRTPMKVTVSTFARRLSTFFLSGGETTNPEPHVTFAKRQDLSVEQNGELNSTEPLLPSCPAQEQATLTPVIPSFPQGYGSFVSSPFVHIGEVEVEAELSLEEAEEVIAPGDSPLKKELSLSLLTCHDGVYPAQIYSSDDRPLSPTPPEHFLSEEGREEDHSYACPFITYDTVQSLTPTPDTILDLEVTEAPVQSPEEKVPEKVTEAPVQSPEEVPEKVTEAPVQSPEEEVLEKVTKEPAVPELSAQQPEFPKPPTSEPAISSSSPSPTLQAQRGPAQTGIRCPSFDPKSPSQVVFKPQWLGKGFGVTGVRVRGVQGLGKGASSPLSVRKPTGSENKGVTSKQKQRGKALIGEGRSPLQILKETNSPRDHASQMKKKVSTPERPRLGQIDRRALSLSMNKENQR